MAKHKEERLQLCMDKLEKLSRKHGWPTIKKALALLEGTWVESDAETVHKVADKYEEVKAPGGKTRLEPVSTFQLETSKKQ